MKKTIVLAAAAFAAISTPLAAEDLPSASVRIADLDLSQEADREKLDRRIDSAARRLCRVEARDGEARKAERACRLAVEADAAPKVELAIAKARGERFATITLDIHG